MRVDHTTYDAPNRRKMFLLRKGEANLPKQSLVMVSQLVTVDKRELVEKMRVASPPPANSTDSAWHSDVDRHRRDIIMYEYDRNTYLIDIIGNNIFM